MKFSFKAKIYKVGINPCVRVPQRISAKLVATNGYIPVKGTIRGFYFQQTLCPIKNDDYRLYVNGPMLKGSRHKVGQEAHFVIEQDITDRNKKIEMPAALTQQLEKENLLNEFEQLAAFRKKEICRYINNLKTDETKERNAIKIVNALKGKATSPLFRLK
jgi:hypothetical protein